MGIFYSLQRERLKSNYTLYGNNDNKGEPEPIYAQPTKVTILVLASSLNFAHLLVISMDIRLSSSKVIIKID